MLPAPTRCTAGDPDLRTGVSGSSLPSTTRTFASHARNSLAVAPPPLPMTAFGHIPAAGRRTKLPTNPARFSRISHIRAFYYDLASLPTFLQLPNGAANRDSVPAVAIAALMLSFSLDGGQTFSILLIPNRTLESNQRRHLKLFHPHFRSKR